MKDVPAGFDIRVGALTLTIPNRRAKVPTMLWGSLAFAAVLERDGYHEIAADQLTKISAWLRRPTPEAESAAKVELPDDERGRGEHDVRRLEVLNARLSKPPVRRGRMSAEDARESDLKERTALEVRPQAKADQRWLERAAAETAHLAKLRGEDVEHKPRGPVRVNSRDPLLSLLRQGHLTAEQYDIGVVIRDCYESRSAGLGSQLGGITGAGGGSSDNSGTIFFGVQRAKANQRIGLVERGILVGFFRNDAGTLIHLHAHAAFKSQGVESHVALQMLRGVCGDGKALSSFGEGRAVERHAKALQLALDVAQEVIRGGR